VEKEILIAVEVAEMLRVDTERIYQMVREKSLPFILLGQRQYRFSKQAIEAWLENGGAQKDDDGNETN
jgi:excisionase family DNA binding protein